MIYVSLSTWYDGLPEVIAVEATLEALTEATITALIEDDKICDVGDRYYRNYTLDKLMGKINNLDWALSYITLDNCSLDSAKEKYISPFTEESK